MANPPALYCQFFSGSATVKTVCSFNQFAAPHGSTTARRISAIARNIFFMLFSVLSACVLCAPLLPLRGILPSPLGCSVLSVSVLFYTMLKTPVSNADLKIRAVLLFVAYICVRFFLLNNRRKNFIFCRLRLHCRADRERLPDLLIAGENVRRSAFICFVTVPECFRNCVAVVFPAVLRPVSCQIFEHLLKICPAITGKGEVIRDFFF